MPAPLAFERIKELKAEAPAKRPFAIVVLGGGVEALAPEYGTSNLQPVSLERLRYGLWLARQTGAPVAFSGGIGHAQQASASEAEVAARIAAQEFGRPLRWIEGESRDTRENAMPHRRASAPAGIDHSSSSPTACTCRARCARSARPPGPAMQIEAAPVSLAKSSDLAVLTWLPSSAGFMQMRFAVRELIGLWAAPEAPSPSHTAAGCPVARRSAASKTSGAHGFCRISKPCFSRRCDA